MNDVLHSRINLACHSLYYLSYGLDMTKQESWDALMAVANELAKTAPDMVADVMMEIERRYK